MNSLLNKIDIFNKEDFQKFEKNWLVMTDKMPFQFLDLDIALNFLNSRIESFEKHIPYNEVFIVTKIRGEKILINSLGNNFEVIAKKDA